MDKHMNEGRSRDALPEGRFEEKMTGTGKTGWNRIRTILLTATAVMLIMSATMGSVWAYFTTYARARGSYVIHMGHQETVEEGFDSWQKAINISSTADSRPVYIRAKAFCAEYEVTYSNSENWVQVGDWMYYVPDSKTLAPGESLYMTSPERDDRLRVQIHDVPKSKTPGMKDGDTFNVIVVYETIEVQYDENGDPLDARNADWNVKVDTNRTTTTLGGDN